MKKAELKKILKPFIKECIKEVIFEDGTLSGIITEVAKSMSPTVNVPPPPPVEEPDPLVERMRRNAFQGAPPSKLTEHKTKLMNAIGKSAYNGVDLFAGTTPTSAQPSPRQQAEPLSDHAPNDPGVDIKSLFGAVGNHWDAHMSATKEVK